MSLSLPQARRAVIDELTRVLDRRPPPAERRALPEAAGLLLAEDLLADRDQPPFDRSTRDGFALRSVDLTGAASAEARPVLLELIGEVAAGATFAGEVRPGTCVEIMTGAPVPAGADAVVMVEHVERVAPGPETGGRPAIRIGRALGPGENVVRRGSELTVGGLALAGGRPLDPAAIGLLAALGAARPLVTRRPRVAIVATGDELVDVEARPRPDQIRDSNRHALAAQIARAGGETVASAVVADDPDRLRAALQQASGAADLLLVSGGVSMGKYDHVEGVLAGLGARTVFDGVDIRPGKPLVFGFLGDRPFFGLPGNPLSTFVTFELFVRPALALLAGGSAEAELSLSGAVLQQAYAQRKLPLTVFVPARLAPAAVAGGLAVAGLTPLVSQGSGDLMSLAAADVLMVVAPGLESIPAGSVVPVLPK